METSVLTAESIVRGQVREDLLREETLADLFRYSANKYPDKAALIFGEESLSYAQLNNWSDAIAVDLIERGIGRGSKIVIWWPRGLELHAAILGIIKAGGCLCTY